MTELNGLPILTAAEMRRAEAAAVRAGDSLDALMERAGTGVADYAARIGSGTPVLVLCGPGNNGGDGYLAARVLHERGIAVSVAALAGPRTDLAEAAAARWSGPVAALPDAVAAPVVIDALFGTGAHRGLESAAADALARLIASARLSLAVDLPSGLDTDSGRPLGPVAGCDLTLALGALKPAHRLQPGASLCGAVRLVDLELAAASEATTLSRPAFKPLAANAQKYTRGMVAIIAGAMPGAATLAGEAALRSGAGYVAVLGGDGSGPAALVQRPFTSEALTDQRGGCVLIGPGLGRDQQARTLLDHALKAGKPLVIDGDALHLLDPAAVPANAILTPHGGEFDALFGKAEADKLSRTRAAARQAGAVVVHKGADTVIAEPAGRAVIAAPSNNWLSTAGTGDVLAGAVAAQLAGGLAPFAAAQAGVWLHARAARMLGASFVADDLARAMTAARAAA